MTKGECGPLVQLQKIKQSTNSVENYNRRYRATFDIFELLLSFSQKGNIANLIRLHSSELICGFYEKKNVYLRAMFFI